MPATHVLNPNFAIQGAYGELHNKVTVPGSPPTVTDTFLANVSKIEGKFTTAKIEVKRSGTRKMAYKRGMISGEGTITQFKVTSAFLSTLVDEFHDETTVPTDLTLLVELNDPEALGSELLELDHVKLWEINFGWTVGDMVEEMIPFTFEDAVLTTPITGTMTE